MTTKEKPRCSRRLKSGQVKRIQRLHRLGHTIGEICEMTQTSAEAVQRTVTRYEQRRSALTHYDRVKEDALAMAKEGYSPLAMAKILGTHHMVIYDVLAASGYHQETKGIAPWDWRMIDQLVGTRIKGTRQRYTHQSAVRQVMLNWTK